ncbi:MAG: tRNA dimethylallyltransferase, partial [Pseudomonadota bacterium]
PVSDEVRTAAAERLAALGADAFRAEVVAIDPPMARLPAGDAQRLKRAWEVYHATGETLSTHQATPRRPVAPRPRARVVIAPPRDAVYRACEERFDAMMAAGALDEAAALAARGLDDALPVMKALGARELIDYLRGDLSLEAAVDLAKRNTRRFVKRQSTWFRGQARDWPTAANSDAARRVLEKAL